MSDSYIKPGWKTTEFWVMVSTVMFGVLLVSGILTNKESNDMLAYINNIMGSGVTIISGASYIISRGKAKQNTNIDYEQLVSDIKDIVQDAKQNE